MTVDARIPGISLRQGEDVVFIARPHWIVFLGAVRIIAYIITLGLALIWMFLNWKSTIYILTTHRVIEQYGVISKTQRNVNLDKVQDAQFQIRGLLARLIGVGNVHVETAGTASNIEMLSVAKPQELCDQIQNEIGAHKKREMMDMAKAMKGDV